MTEEEHFKKIEEELEGIKREVKISSFDTIYTSFIIFVASTILGFLLANKMNDWIVYFGGGALISIILQCLSIFTASLKKWSIIVFEVVILYGILIYSYILFPVQELRTWDLRNIISAIIFFAIIIGSYIKLNNYFKK